MCHCDEDEDDLPPSKPHMRPVNGHWRTYGIFDACMHRMPLEMKCEACERIFQHMPMPDIFSNGAIVLQPVRYFVCAS